MFQLIRDACRRRVQRELPKLDEAAVGETVEEKQSMSQLIRDACRRRVQQEHPKLDEAAVEEIVENVQRVYQLIPDACRRRVQQERPELDEAAVDEIMMWIPSPPMRLVESALVQRMHLPEEERMQQVAMMMVSKLLGS